MKDEILSLYNRYKIKNFTFVDSLVNGSLIHFRKLVYALNEEVDKGNLPKLRIAGYSRVHSDMDEDLMMTASKVGYDLLSIGIESGSPKILELIEKGQTVEMAEEFLKNCWKGGIWTVANWITGYPKENQIDWLVSLYFLYKNRKYLPDVSANYRPAGVTPGTALDVYRETFDLDPVGHVLLDFVSENAYSTYINRNLRHKLTHLYLDLFNYFYSGSTGIRDTVEYFEFKDKKNFDFNGEFFQTYPVRDKGCFWIFQEHEDRYPEIFENIDLKMDVPYLEFANKPEPKGIPRDRPVADIIKEQTRNEIRVWVWFIHQIVGPFKIKFKLEDSLPERNFPGIHFTSVFDFESHFDGSYTLDIKNELKFDESAQNGSTVWLRNPQQTEDKPEDYCYHDIQFVDHFEDSGNFNDRYNESNHIDKIVDGVPNYIDTYDAEKYRINLRRTEMTGKF